MQINCKLIANQIITYISSKVIDSSLVLYSVFLGLLLFHTFYWRPKWNGVPVTAGSSWCKKLPGAGWVITPVRFSQSKVFFKNPKALWFLLYRVAGLWYMDQEVDINGVERNLQRYREEVVWPQDTLESTRSRSRHTWSSKRTVLVAAVPARPSTVKFALFTNFCPRVWRQHMWNSNRTVMVVPVPARQGKLQWHLFIIQPSNQPPLKRAGNDIYRVAIVQFRQVHC